MVRQAVSNEAAPAHGHTARRKSSVWKDFDYVNVPGASAMATCKTCGSTYHASSKTHGTSHLRRHAKSSCCAKRAAERAAPCLPAAAPADDHDDDEEALEKWINKVLIDPDSDAGLFLMDEPLDSGTATDSPFTDGHQVDGGGEVAAARGDDNDEGSWTSWGERLEDLHNDPEYDPGLFCTEEQQDGGLATTDSPQLDGGTEAGLTTTDSPFTYGRRVAAAGDLDRRFPNFMPDTRMPQAQSSSSTRFFKKKRERSANLASHQGGTTDKDHPSRVNTDWALTEDNSMVYTDFTFGDAYD